jgi:hypothetical protein
MRAALLQARLRLKPSARAHDLPEQRLARLLVRLDRKRVAGQRRQTCLRPGQVPCPPSACAAGSRILLELVDAIERRASDEVVRLVPMPKPSIGAPGAMIRERIVLVEAAAGEDDTSRRPPASRICRTLRDRRKIAAVEAHAAIGCLRAAAVERARPPSLPPPRCRRYRSAARGSRAATGEALEGFDLVVVRLHEGMRHRAEERDAEVLRRAPSRCRRSRRCSSRARREAGLGAMRAAQPEIDELLPRRGQHHARGLRGDQRSGNAGG